MGRKMSERMRAIIINAAIIAGLAWCYIQGYPYKVILGSGVFLLLLANGLMYLRRSRSTTRD